jgi:hypothetical protein
MSLVNELEVTINDLLPRLSDGMLITDPHRGTAIAVSGRLYARLKAYADQYQFSVQAVVQQLRDEIHSAPIASIHPTMTTPQFGKGDRVKLSAKRIKTLRHSPGSPVSSPWWRMRTNRSGTVAHNSREENGVAVIWDGTKTPQYISSELLERSDD